MPVITGVWPHIMDGMPTLNRMQGMMFALWDMVNSPD